MKKRREKKEEEPKRRQNVWVTGGGEQEKLWRTESDRSGRGRLPNNGRRKGKGWREEMDE